MHFYIELLLVLLMRNEILCRTLDSKTMASVIGVFNQSNATINIANSTEAYSFEICELFGDMDQLKFRDQGITVITKLF